MKDCKVIVEDVVRDEWTANENVNEYQNEETEKVQNQPQNERNDYERNHEMELPKEQTDEPKKEY